MRRNVRDELRAVAGAATGFIATVIAEGPEDDGCIVCGKDADFRYSVLMGNDMVTPHREWGFAG